MVVKQPDTGAAQASKYKRVNVDTSVWPPKFCKLELRFEDGTRLAFTDPRRFARVTLEADPQLSARVAALGPDAHTDKHAITQAWWAQRLASRGIPVKALLLEQSFVAGIGNWIADEVLFQAGVHPETPANALAPDEAERLRTTLFSVVDHAVSVDANDALFPPSWLFHHRWGKGKGPAKTHDGRPIEFITVGGRTSAVVAAVQVLRRAAGKVAAAALTSSSSSSDGAEASGKAQRKTSAVGGKKRKSPTAVAEVEPPIFTGDNKISAVATAGSAASDVQGSFGKGPAKRRKVTGTLKATPEQGSVTE